MESAIDRMLKSRRIAIVGLSDDPSRPSYQIARYLLDNGYEIVPVNPSHPIVLNLPCVASLAEIEGSVDLVNVFRRSEFCEQIARDALAIGAKGIWLQMGIQNGAAAKLAREARIDYVENRCIKIDHMRWATEGHVVKARCRAISHGWLSKGI